jgi:hypothetical protein
MSVFPVSPAASGRQIALEAYRQRPNLARADA